MSSRLSVGLAATVVAGKARLRTAENGAEIAIEPAGFVAWRR